MAFVVFQSRSGTALTFVTRDDWGSAQKLLNIMVEANQEVPNWLVEMADRYKAYRERRREEGTKSRSHSQRLIAMVICVAVFHLITVGNNSMT